MYVSAKHEFYFLLDWLTVTLDKHNRNTAAALFSALQG